jgi:quercetin dioxygenase-like cupin family protein
VLDPGKVLEPHIHKKGHAVILVLAGEGFALVGGRRYPLRRHSVINVPPGTEHGLEAGNEKLVVYGFQVPAIIDENNDADIYFTKDNRKGEVEAIYG